MADFLQRSGSLDALLRLREHAPVPWLSVLTYHQFPRGEHASFDEGVVDVTPAEFERHVKFIKRYFSVVGADEICDFVDGAPLPKNPVAIAFDDGYAGNFDLALPILARHDCKAMFFVPTGFVEERRVHWWDRISYILKASTRREIRLEYPFNMRVDLSPPRDPAIRCLHRLVKSHPSLDLERFLTELAASAGVPWSREQEREHADRLIMTWEQVRALARAGMDVESHTRTHRVLQTLNDADLQWELEGSRADIARQVGRAPRTIAFPVGNPLSIGSPIRAALSAAGYDAGFTHATGATPLRHPVDGWNLCRQSVERSLSDAFLLTILAVPQLAPKHPWHLLVNASA